MRRPAGAGGVATPCAVQLMRVECEELDVKDMSVDAFRNLTKILITNGSYWKEEMALAMTVVGPFFSESLDLPLCFFFLRLFNSFAFIATFFLNSGLGSRPVPAKSVAYSLIAELREHSSADLFFTLPGFKPSFSLAVFAGSFPPPSSTKNCLPSHALRTQILHLSAQVLHLIRSLHHGSLHVCQPILRPGINLLYLPGMQASAFSSCHGRSQSGRIAGDLLLQLCSSRCRSWIFPLALFEVICESPEATTLAGTLSKRLNHYQSWRNDAGVRPHCQKAL